jgi:bacillithiol biosynthesis cysteine-adding enzyme BshC
MKVIEIDIEKVSQFSDRDRDYILNSTKFKDLLNFDFEYNQFAEVIKKRSNYKTNRSLLYDVITHQYTHLKTSDKTQIHINNLQKENTFSITTAHQPSLLTGPLYVPFKILSTINLCQRLANDFPEFNFVPVFITGGEDHDYEEINHLHLYSKTITWNSDHSGAVGQFPTNGLKEVITEVKDILGDKSNLKEFLDALSHNLEAQKTYGQFSIDLIHALFDGLGLVIINMDNPKLKREFIPLIKKEILESFSYEPVQKAQEKIEGLGYSPQTHIRDINFFYKKDQLRNRIEKDGDHFRVVDTNISFSEKELIAEIDNYPERFSPNVIMRPLYQELILPNLAYIGGGGELAYWMERKTQFDAAKLPFPMLIRRVSGMIVSDRMQSQLNKINMDLPDLFIPHHDLVKKYLQISEAPDFSLEEFKKEIETIYKRAEEKIVAIDKSLGKTTQAEKVKAQKSFDYLESKLKKYVKQQEESSLNKISKLKDKFFPSNGLQERHDNMLEYMSTYGIGIIEKLLTHCDPFDKIFKVFLMQPEDH